MTPEQRIRNRAHQAVFQAVRRGRLTPGGCEVGVDCKGRVQAHHDDYSKPLEVRWLCRRHHKMHHDGPRKPPHALKLPKPPRPPKPKPPRPPKPPRQRPARKPRARKPPPTTHALVPRAEVRTRLSGPLDCVLWLGAVTPRGYPVVKIGGRTRLVRRVIYEREKRALQPRERVVMECDERLCVLADHMRAIQWSRMM